MAGRNLGLVPGSRPANASSPAERWHQLDHTLVRQICRHAGARFGEEWERAVLQREPLLHDPVMPQIVFPFLAYEAKVQGRTAVSWFLEDRGRYLAQDERPWLEAQSRSWLSAWELLDVTPGAGFDARDLLTGETRSIAGHLVMLSKSLKLMTNSRERADELKARFERLCAGLIVRPRRTEEDVETMMAKSARTRRPTRSSEPTGPEVDALLLELKENHYSTWADVSLPALDGLTPREASTSPTHRGRLELLLKEMEEFENRDEAGRRFDFRKVRAQLGM